MLSITALGSITIALLITGLIYSEGEKKLGETLLTGLILSSTLTYSIKYAVARSRPETMMSNLIASTPSFPSGHTTVAFTLAAVLGSRFNKKAMYSLAALIAISRVYLGAHYPSDILVGAFIGITSGKIVLKRKQIYTKLSETISSTFS
ncbi:undecaprenyl-diphosphatase [Candidatus Nanohalobium constans]|uniref:Undecaprenyl-diphosphatase n=2 Tax=Candidatus Nanohalobium constans TaxID=2565781 RepID=A0A5Q0UFZ4_9ARCH|nr:undecaprenyl-diphosphatase [Candidatus Nanohalobium constans]